MLGVVHLHSRYSHDGRDTLAELREFALARRLRFVGLTDHAEDLDAERFAAYRRECAELSDARVTLIPGLEFRFAGHGGLHLLALGLERWVAPATPEAFMREAATAARFTILAHPRLARYRVPHAVQRGIDAVEVWNAAYDTRYLPDDRAIRLLWHLRRRRPEVVGVAGLDQHDCANDRETRLVLTRDGAADPLAELRAGRFVNVGRTMRFDSGGRIAPLPFTALRVGRSVLDRVNRWHDRAVRAARGLA